MGRLLRTGERVGAYEILRLLASGGEGASYLARHAARGEVVLKQYALSASEPSCRAEAERIERRKALIGVRHPCVAEVLDIFVDGDLYYEVLEYVAGVSLEERLERGLLLTEDEAVSVARCCLEGLVWLHTEVRLVHRDIKPGNVMLLEGPSGELQCKLIDMGIVLFLDHTRLTASGVACTFLYAAPEAFLGPKAAIDGRADLHSLAVTLFESVAGTLPFRGTTVESLITEICGPHRPRLRDAAAGISPRFDAFVAKLMAPKPEDRPASARKALNLLDALPLRESRSGRTGKTMTTMRSSTRMKMRMRRRKGAGRRCISCPVRFGAGASAFPNRAWHSDEPCSAPTTARPAGSTRGPRCTAPHCS